MIIKTDDWQGDTRKASVSGEKNRGERNGDGQT